MTGCGPRRRQSSDQHGIYKLFIDLRQGRMLDRSRASANRIRTRSRGCEAAEKSREARKNSAAVAYLIT